MIGTSIIFPIIFSKIEKTSYNKNNKKMNDYLWNVRFIFLAKECKSKTVWPHAALISLHSTWKIDWLIDGRIDRLMDYDFYTPLTLSQATTFTLFQSERVCRWPFPILWKWHKIIQIRCVCETLMPPKQPFFRNVTLIFDLDLDDMTLTSKVLSKATCIP